MGVGGGRPEVWVHRPSVIRWALLVMGSLLLLVGCDPLEMLLPLVDTGSQGIFGTVWFLPGVCLADPENPGGCLNGPFPGRAAFVVRKRSDTPDQGLSDPIVRAFESDDDGTFRIGLAPGEYCVWWTNTCTPIQVKPDEWSEVSLFVPLP